MITAAFCVASVTGAVAITLEKIGDDIFTDDPIACHHNVDDIDRVVRLAHATVGKRVSLDQAIVRRDIAFGIDFEMRIEISDRIVACDKMISFTDDMKCMFAAAMGCTDANDSEIFKLPVRCSNLETLDQIKFEGHGFRSGCPDDDRTQCSARANDTEI